MSRGQGRTLAIVLAIVASAARPVAEAEPRVPPTTVTPRAAGRGTASQAGGAAQSVPKPGRPARAARPSPAELRAARLGLGDMRAAGRLLAGRPEAQWVRAAGAGTGLSGDLRLPVAHGHIARGFGSGKGGYHQAVDIAGELGAKVYAAAAGIVGYADDGVSGYGNMIILVHPGGQITTYAHNQKNLVVAGQRVARGALIAKLGSSGLSKGPHVHFELLFAGENCDPMPLLRPPARRANGALAAPALSVWKQANKRPKSVRCGARKHHPDYVGKAGDGADADEGEPAGP